MKLGDNMTTVEACNVWGEETACTRKTRPPRIGEIPRYTAVDEESPGSGSNKLTGTSPSRESSRFHNSSSTLTGGEGMLELRLSNHGDVFSSKTSPVKKSAKCDDDDDDDTRVNECNRLSGISRSSISSHDPDTDHSSIETLNADTRIPSVTVMKDVKVGQSNEDHSQSRSEMFREIDDDRGNLVRICSTPSQEIREVRKDSALYLEEVEGLRDLRESLKSRSPRSLTPRRESSGYASNLGTFDEDRRTSEVDLTPLRERRRSSTKRLTSETFIPVARRISRNDENSTCNWETGSVDKILPTTDIHRRVSTSGLDMSDIQEVRDAEFDERSSREEDEDEDKEEGVEKAEEDQKIESVSSEGKLSNIFASFEAKDSSRDSNTPKNESTEGLPGEILSYAEVLAKSSTTSPGAKNTTPTNCRSRILSRVESFDAGDVPSKILQIGINQGSSGSKILQRKRMIVHQYSTPNFSSMELESISEKPVEKSPDNSNQVDIEETNIQSATRVTVEDTSQNEEKIVNAPSKILPKSVKVYQLLSTQSEDRGDGVPNLSDRRISLQITRQEDDQLDSTDEKLRVGKNEDGREGEGNSMLNVPDAAVGGSTVGGGGSGSSSGSTTDPCNVVHLTPTMVAGSCFPVRKLSTPAEMGSSQRIPGDSTGIGIRPIYPYCPYSPYGSPQGSPRTRRRPLRESRRVSIDNRQGALQLNQYKLLDNIGQGSFGIVKLAYNEEDKTHYAMKILSKKKLMKKAGIFGRMAPGRKGLANPLAKVYREIALLKKLDHPNVVKLVEVLDDPDEDNLYLAFELVQKGEVLQLPTEHPLDEDNARRHFRDIVLGVEYLHYQRIVHRDIKPSNLLVDSEGRVKVADLGVSAELRAAGELLSGPAGTPAFAAPETTTPGAQYSGTLCDVWSMGVTLYSLVTGRVPWDGSGSIIGVQAAVRSEPLKFPDKPELSESLRDLITKMLDKEPSGRITLQEIKQHPWVTKNATELLPSETDNCRLPVTVTDEEVARVVTRVPKLDTLILIKTMLKQHSFQNPFLPKRSSKSVSNDTIPGEVSPNSSSATCSVRNSSVVNSTISNSRTEKFHEAGRSNSAPDTFECHMNDRPVSLESQLPPVTEALIQENDSVKR